MQNNPDLPIESGQSMRRKQLLTWGLSAFGIIAIIVIVLKFQESTTAGSDEKAVLNIRKKVNAISSEDTMKNVWIEKSEEKIKHLEDGMKEQNETLKRLTAILENEKNNPGGYKENRIKFDYSSPPQDALPLWASSPPINPVSKSSNSLNLIPSQPDIVPLQREERRESSIRVIIGSPMPEKKEKEEEKKLLENPEKKELNAKVYLSAATFIPTILLSGLDAPTNGQAQSSPHPVLLLVQDLSTMPTQIRKNAKECRIIASGYGSLSSERAYIRGETITCEMKNGKFIEKPIKGYLAGEDGKNGIRGRVVEKSGKYLAYSLASGFAEGVSKGFKTATNTVSVSPLGTTSSVDSNKLLESGAYSGGATAMERLADYYIKKAEEIFAIIEIDASRKVEFVVLEGVELS